MSRDHWDNVNIAASRANKAAIEACDAVLAEHIHSDEWYDAQAIHKRLARESDRATGAWFVAWHYLPNGGGRL